MKFIEGRVVKVYSFMRGLFMFYCYFFLLFVDLSSLVFDDFDVLFSGVSEWFFFFMFCKMVFNLFRVFYLLNLNVFLRRG